MAGAGKTVGICIAIIMCAFILREITKKDREGGSQLLNLPGSTQADPEAPTQTRKKDDGADEVAQLKKRLAELELAKDLKSKINKLEKNSEDPPTSPVVQQKNQPVEKPKLVSKKEEAAPAAVPEKKEEKSDPIPPPPQDAEKPPAAADTNPTHKKVHSGGGQNPPTQLDIKLDAIFTQELNKEVEGDIKQGLRKEGKHVPLCYSVTRDVLDVQLAPGVGGNPKNMSQRYDPDDPYPDIGMCPLTRRVLCEEGDKPGDAKKVKGKGLVLVQVHGFEHDDQPAEAGNVDFFNQFGVIPEDYPTQLFDSVDFVFWRHSHSRVDDALGNESAAQATGGVALCTEVGNVKYVWVTDAAACKVCGVAKVLSYLGFDKDADLLNINSVKAWPYRSLTYFETSIRGPFLNEWSRGGGGSSADRPGHPRNEASSRPSGKYSSWLDVLSLAGRPRRPLYLDDELAAIKAVQNGEGASMNDKLPESMKLAFFNDVDAATVSQEMTIHMQTVITTVPRALHKKLFEHLSSVCHLGASDCIHKHEAVMANTLLKGTGIPGSIFFRHQRWRQFPNTDVAAKLREIGVDGNNPVRRHSDPCEQMFVVYGSKAIDLLPKSTRRSVSFLTAIMTSEFGPSLPLADRRDILAGTARCGWYVRPHAPGQRSQGNPAHTRVMNIGAITPPRAGKPPLRGGR